MQTLMSLALKQLRRYCFIGLTVLIPVVPLNAAATKPKLALDQQEAIRELVRDYLLTNPEIIIEALGVYEARKESQARDEAKANLGALQAELFNNPQDPIMGNPAGDVTIVEFFDYQCGYCKRVAGPLIETMTEDDNIKVVLKELPILGPASVFAAKAALASQAQSAYNKFHFALLSHRGRLSDAVVLKIAGSIGIDVVRLKADMDAPAITAVISANQELANALNLRGTPAFVIGDELVPGAVDASGFRSLVAKARKNN